MSTRRASSVLVGRDPDLRALEAAVADRTACPLTLVGGEAGVGKTRLVAEFLARRPGGATTTGGCIELGSDLVPFAPFVDAISMYLEALLPSEIDRDADRDGRPSEGMDLPPSISALLPDLAPLVPGFAPSTIVADAPTRGRMYEAVRALFDRAPEPLVCVIEDLHWADRSSLELLAYLTRRLRHGRTAIIATFRVDELHRRHPLVSVLAELERSGRATRLELQRLDGAHVADLVRAIHGDAPDELVQQVARRSEGIPFLVEELLAVDAAGSEPLPSTLRDLLLARTASLDDEARGTLAVVAAIGRPADTELIEATSGRGLADLDGDLRAAVDRGILVADATSGRISFRHALLAEAVLDDLLPGERLRLHAALARALSRRPDLARPTAAGAAAELAHHLYAAGDMDGALRASVAAADVAVAGRAFPEARALYERALELIERRSGPVEGFELDRIAILDAAAGASFHAGHIARAIALGTRAAHLSEEAGDAARTGYLLGRLVQWTELSGDFERVTELARQAVALVPERPPSPARALALIGLAAALGHAGRAVDCLAVAREAIEVAQTCGASAHEAVARSNAAAALVKLGRDREAVAEIDRAVNVVERTRGTDETAVVQTDRAVVYATAARFGDLPSVLTDVRTALEREGAFEVHEPWFRAPESELLVWQGRWFEAEDLTTRLIDKRVEPSPLACHLVLRGRLRARTGRFEDAERDLDAVLVLTPTVEPETRADALAARAELATLRRSPSDALERAEEGLAVLDSVDDPPLAAHLLALACEAAADLCERAAARRDGKATVVAEAAISRHRRRLGELALDAAAIDAPEVRVRSRLLWASAELDRSRGVDEADTWSAAADALLEAGEPYLANRARLRAAEAALMSSNDRVLAGQLLRDVHLVATRLGADPLAERAASLAKRARIDLLWAESRDGRGKIAEVLRPADPYGLSPREREVLALLVDGRTNRQIGAELFVSEKTASVHVTHILDKLGVASRGAAAALAVRGGLVPPFGSFRDVGEAPATAPPTTPAAPPGRGPPGGSSRTRWACLAARARRP